jgi:GTP cyclohydrolase I
MTTNTFLGAFKEDKDLRREFLAEIQKASA